MWNNAVIQQRVLPYTSRVCITNRNDESVANREEQDVSLYSLYTFTGKRTLQLQGIYVVL